MVKNNCAYSINLRFCVYPSLLHYHQQIQTNGNHSLQYKNSFANNLSSELLGKEISVPLFMQNYFSGEKNIKQFTDLRDKQSDF